ncbi:hypothetical protein AB0F91_06620 [Amycolatopsis sp. NPDC023774]|uniref:hypothetical protein n=1 Tax=Amycolatopsis sp. NPDC023774 TaxID=3155015 RepID=UPI0033DD7D6C
MTRDLLDRALGSDEPPLRLDFEAIAAQGARSVRRRARLALAGSAAAVVVAALGAVAVLRHEPVSPASSGQITYAKPNDREIAYCYHTADITSPAPNQHVPAGINGNSPNGRGDIAAAIMDICVTAWRDDYYEWHSPTVPPLVACVLTSAAVGVEAGAVGVFPGDERTCAVMGLPVANLSR